MPRTAPPQRNAPRFSRQQGSLVVYLVVGLVAFGLLALAGASRYGATAVGTALPNCATRAKLMGEAGVRFATARLRACTDETQVNTAVAAMDNHTYTVDAAKGLAFTLRVTYSSGTASITSTGQGCPSSLAAVSASPNAVSVNLPGISGGGAATSEALKGTYSGTSAIIAGAATGNVTTSSATVQGGTIVKGSLNYLGTGSCLTLTGGVSVGTPGGTDYVCSDSCVVVEGGSIIYGDIFAQGDVVVRSATITGDIHSGGDVRLDWGANVQGDIYASGTFSMPPYFSYSGTVHTGAATPAQCASYTLPAHKVVAASGAFNLGGGSYTFYGTSNLADTTNSFSSFTTGWGSRICFDLSTPGTSINIFVGGAMSSNSDIYVRTSSAGGCFAAGNLVASTLFANYAAASRIYMDVRGTVSFGGSRNWFGTIYASDNIYPGGGGNYIGAFYTNKSFNPTNQWVSTRFVASDYVAAYWP